MKKKDGESVIPQEDALKFEDMQLIFDSMAHDYAELVKKFNSLNKEKQSLQLIVDDLIKANRVLENDFKVLFR
jgi:hypothetical protein